MALGICRSTAQTVLFVRPEHDTNRTTRAYPEFEHQTCGFPRDDAPHAIVRGAGADIPRIQVPTEQHDLIRLLASDDLADDIRRFDVSLATLGVRDEGLRARLLAAYAALAPYSEVAATLAALKGAGRRLAVLSNGSPAMLEQALASAGLDHLLDEVLSVEEVGVFKPAPEVYHLATTRLGLPASRIAFLSSNGWDVHGAAAFGLMAVWVNRAGAVDERLPGTPAAIIPSLVPLPGLLGVAAGG